MSLSETQEAIGGQGSMKTSVLKPEQSEPDCPGHARTIRYDALVLHVVEDKQVHRRGVDARDLPE